MLKQTTDNGHASGDTLISIENVIGSNHGDTLTAVDRNRTAAASSPAAGAMIPLPAAAGSDTFVFASGDGDDEINTFTIADDKIDLSAFTSIASLDDLKDDISDRGGDIEIDLPGNGEIRLNAPTGLEASAEDFFGLTADNFIFYTKPTSGTHGRPLQQRDQRRPNGDDDHLRRATAGTSSTAAKADDEIYGGEDNDTINGGEGNDWLDGGPGADTFVFEPGNGNDVIMDFEAGATGDTIILKGFKNADGTDAMQ